MRIKEHYKNKPVISLEIFPPKPGSPLDGVFATIDALSVLRPDYISVTYGAAGGSRSYTVEIADTIKNKYGIEALAHLTCINSSREEVAAILERLQKANVENVLALRGDRPEDQSMASPSTDFAYAADLIAYIKTTADFCIGAACYPEVHTEAENALADLRNLKKKVDTGVDFLITQLFLDNSLFYAFRDKLEKMRIEVPVSAGIMPVLNKKQIERITSLCGASIPPKFRRILDKYENNPEALREAGIAYATEQIIDLLSSEVDGIHLYTMNRPEVAKQIFGQISVIRKHLKAEA